MNDREMDDRFEIRFTREEAELIRSDLLADDAITEQLRNAVPAPDGSVCGEGTLDDLDDLLGSIAAAENHCEDAELAAHLDHLYTRLERLGRAAFLMQDAGVEANRARSTGTDRQRSYVMQFRIELLGTDPPVWRRIQISSDSTFWDLHVAIQDVMGWQDYHLHQFTFLGTEDRIGTPLVDEPSEILPGWKLRVGGYLTYGKPLALYEYDFGDSWFHEIRFETSMPIDRRRKYPRCLAGARRCPPKTAAVSADTPSFSQRSRIRSILSTEGIASGSAATSIPRCSKRGRFASRIRRRDWTSCLGRRRTRRRAGNQGAAEDSPGTW